MESFVYSKAKVTRHRRKINARQSRGGMASSVFGTLLKLWRGEYELAVTVFGGGLVTWLFCSAVLFAIKRINNAESFHGE